jgi:hypothetical protein
MREITVYYQNGIVESHHEPYISDIPATVKPTSFRLRLDLLNEEGLLVEVTVNLINEAGTAQMADHEANITWTHARRTACGRVRLVSKDELYNISKIVVDDEIIVWRQGDQLINGILFYTAELLYFSDTNTASVNSKIVELYNYLKAANPDTDDKYIARRFGLNTIALAQIMDEEARNLARRIGDDDTVLEVGSSQEKTKRHSAKDRSDDEDFKQENDAVETIDEALSIFNDYLDEDSPDLS